ncbi:hypothetical protein [Streptomyces sp. NRRL F-2664]|uniref:hypothetical protein n=1 Tax=Streptomyces sp. NRRL F-2664 TaxID=1463842 RepID=UPI0004C8207A|nr:hypothetical protein [Streptomyces sp. NRRL F-2664]
MGADITVLVADWAHVMDLAPEDRLRVVQESAYADDDPDGSGDVVDGWVWPAAGSERAWLGRYEFPGTLGSYKPHFWAAEGWERVRGAAEDGVRAALDEFLEGLIWWGPQADVDAEQVDPGVFASLEGLWRPGPLIVLSPATVARLRRRWLEAAPGLEGLRVPYAELAGRQPGQWVARFDEFTELVSGWAEVVDEADRRGWRVIGLPI